MEGDYGEAVDGR